VFIKVEQLLPNPKLLSILYFYQTLRSYCSKL
jgi:hypothetical protein